MKIFMIALLALQIFAKIQSSDHWSVSGFDSGGFMAN